MSEVRKQPIYLGTSGDPENYAADTHPYPGQVGLKAQIVQPHRTAPGAEAGRPKTYQLVQGDSTMSTAPFHGAVVWWADKSKYKVSTSPTATNRNNIAGVVQVASGATAPGKGQYFFIQVQGPATVKVIDASNLAVTAGDTAIPSSTDGKADRTAAGTAPTYRPLGIYVGTTNLGAAEQLVDLDVPDVP